MELFFLNENKNDFFIRISNKKIKLSLNKSLKSCFKFEVETRL